jgi:hypothetical protein
MLPAYLNQQTASNSTDVPTVELATGNSMYTGEIEIDGEKFTVDFDTGSATLVVPAKNYRGRADNKTSTECTNDPLRIQYGSGSTRGCEGTGTFGILDFEVHDYKYLAYQEFAQDGGNAPAFNLCGLGWQMLDRGVTNQKPFIQLLHEQKAIDEPMFSFSLANLGTSGQSELYLGELDESAYDGEMSWIPTVTTEEGNRGYWMIEHEMVFHRDSGFTGGFRQVHTVVDSGTTLIALASEEFHYVSRGFQNIMSTNNYVCGPVQDMLFCGREVASCPESGEVACLTASERGRSFSVEQDFDEKILDEVVFTMRFRTVDGQQTELPLRVRDLLMDMGDNTLVFGVSQAPQGIDFNLFGDVFMDGVYTVFSYDRGDNDRTKSHPAIGFGKRVATTQTLLV